MELLMEKTVMVRLRGAERRIEKQKNLEGMEDR
jgi:hypothetical protein